MKRSGYFLTIVFTLCAFSSLAQIRREIDSLMKIYTNPATPDSLKLKAVDDIAWDYLSINPDSTIVFAKQQLELANKTRNLKWASKAYNMMGTAHFNKAEYPPALINYQNSLKLREQLKDQYGVAVVYGNLGNVSQAIGENEKSIEYQLKSLKIMEELQNKAGIARAVGNIGLIYTLQKETEKALEYQLKSLAIMEELGDKEGCVVSLLNIATLYKEQQKIEEAVSYQMKGLQFSRELNNRRLEAASLQNLGNIYNAAKRTDLAIQYCLKALPLAEEIGELNIQKVTHQTLSEIYKAKGDAVKALMHYEKFIAIKEQIFKEENQKEITKKEIQFEYDKKAAADSVRNANEKLITDARIAQQDAKLKQEQTQRYALYGGILLVLLFLGFMYNRFTLIRKQKNIIESQKQIVEEKQREVMDSINYAKRIQYALLAGDKILSQYLPEYFVLYKPKDIVSGDFYWAGTQGNKFYLCVADCTGHGVPGAFMSLLNISFLNEALSEKHIESPDKILEDVRQQIILSLNPEGREEESKDGMDAVLCMFDMKGMWLRFACANNPLWLVRNNELKVFEPDKMPVGKHHGEQKPFTLQTLGLRKGDLIYLLTDGYADQFGGGSGKKFKYKELQKMVLENSARPMAEQQKIFDATLEKWKGNLEQVDDILIIGIRL